MSELRPSPWPAQRAKLIQLVSDMVKALVDDEKAVRVTGSTDEHCTTIEVKVNPREYPKVVGRNGRHIHALIVLVSAAGGKFGKRVVLSLVEAGPRRRPHASRQPSEDFAAVWRDPK